MPYKSQITITHGTIFNGSHLPLPKWFLAMYLIAASSKGISAMMVDGTPFLLDGIVEIGETFSGAWPRRPSRPHLENHGDDRVGGGNGGCKVKQPSVGIATGAAS